MVPLDLPTVLIQEEVKRALLEDLGRAGIYQRRRRLNLISSRQHYSWRVIMALSVVFHTRQRLSKG